MRGFFRLGAPDSTDGTSSDHHHHHHGHHHGPFSHHSHHGSSSNGGERRSNSSNASPHPSSNPASGRRSQYPEALPSALSKRFTGPAIGTAVLDESTMPLEDAAVLFEMVTPESTPLRKSHVKERFEAAIDEAVEQRRQAAREQAGVTSTSNDSSADEPASDPHRRSNSFSFFKIDHSVASTSPENRAMHHHHHHRRQILNSGGYVVFTDSYLSAHPNSVVTGVTSELQLAAANELSAFHHRATGPDAEKQKLQEIKDYIREVEHEYRPLFRRRTSEMVYGRGQYLSTSSPDLTNSEVYYATPMTNEPSKVESEPKKAKTKLRKVFSSPLF